MRAEFGRRVRDERCARGLTQADLAGLMTAEGHRMHQTAVAKLEGGARPTSIDELLALAALLRVSPADLLPSSPPRVPNATGLAGRLLGLIR